MRDLVGKTAFVTGGASGIGFALGQAFAEAGMQVMLADIEANALAVAVENLRGLGLGVRGVGCDVTNPSSVEHAAEASYEAFGNVHVRPPDLNEFTMTPIRRSSAVLCRERPSRCS